MTFGDGWKIVRLLMPEALDREGEHMQHCIGKGAYDHHLDGDSHVFYSLRDPKNRPHATMEVENEAGIAKLIQCKGKKNALLMEKYYSYTIPFVRGRGLEAPLDPNAAGIIKYNGKYYTIYSLPEYSLPEGYETFRLDLSFFCAPPALPKGLKIEYLRLNDETAPQIPEDCEITGYVELYWRKGGKLHREDGPAVIERDSNTGEITRREWYLNGEEVTSEQAGDYSYRREPALEAA
jgi:hypothetical protein